MKTLTWLPFFALLIVVYVAFAVFGPVDMSTFLAQEIVYQTEVLPSTEGRPLLFSVGDLFVFVGLILLALEILKATNTRSVSLQNHGLSALVAVVCIVLFIAVKGFGTTTFFLITVMSLFDVVIGMLITIITARRDIGVPGIG